MAAVQGADKVARGLGNVALKVCGCADEKSSFCPQWSPVIQVVQDVVPVVLGAGCGLCRQCTSIPGCCCTCR